MPPRQGWRIFGLGFYELPRRRRWENCSCQPTIFCDLVGSLLHPDMIEAAWAGNRGVGQGDQSTVSVVGLNGRPVWIGEQVLKFQNVVEAGLRWHGEREGRSR
jgi:hypothetical protein